MIQSDVLVKWTGSKRLQGSAIIEHLPKKIETYFEPFIGGASMLFVLLQSGIEVERYRCSDLNTPLVGIWNLVKDDPDKLLKSYQSNWNQLQKLDKEHYYKVRADFNSDQDPFKFFFLLRTCRNGLVRYNKKGEFNSGFHLGRSGIRPDNLKPTLKKWHQMFSQVDIEFENKDYRQVTSTKNDFVYLDPPYQLPAARRTVMYYGDFDFESFWGWLGKQKASYALSLNGFKDKTDCRIDVPKNLYNELFLIHNGLNKFDQMCNKRVVAQDSLYVRNHGTS